MQKVNTVGGTNNIDLPAIELADALPQLSVGASANNTATIQAEGLYRIWASVDAWVLIKPSATATAAPPSTPVTAKAGEYFIIRAGDRVSAIRQASDGFLIVTPAEQGSKT